MIMKQLIVLTVLYFFFGFAKSQDLKGLNLLNSDSLKLVQLFQNANENSWSQKSLHEIELEVAQFFKGSLYVSNTLDQDSIERLVVDLQGFDCVTFVENVAALSFTIQSGALTLEKYYKNLQSLRYRNGFLNGYASRLHYFTDWLTDNQQKGIIEIVSNQLGTDALNSKVDIISRNWEKHRFHTDTALLHRMQETEKRISIISLKYISKDQLELLENKIKNGDIIAITTSINGLDVAHTGLAVFVNGRLHLFHASSALGKVLISKEPLCEYLQAKKSFTGILVGRLRLSIQKD
jgi:hypothetical protein